jgi:uncharacterized membrane protein (UPF0127 family)
VRNLPNKAKRSSVLIIIAIIAIIAVAAAAYLPHNNTKQQPSSFILNGKSYAITGYASTQAQQEKGLMNATVTNSTFMLFYFGQPGIYPFWMKNTYNSLDIIWLDYNSTTKAARVVYFVNATPCVSYSPNQTNCAIYTPNSYANYVLETKAGFVQQNNVGIGTDISFQS